MKATAETTTKTTVFISLQELVEFVQAKGIHVPSGPALDIYAAPFDDEFLAGAQGVLLEWRVVHAPKQG
jgi:hypothetical protein